MTITQIDAALPPNHHADHRGFSGVGGLVAALGFNFGRGADAELAVQLAASATATTSSTSGAAPASLSGAPALPVPPR